MYRDLIVNIFIKVSLPVSFVINLTAVLLDDNSSDKLEQVLKQLNQKISLLFLLKANINNQYKGQTDINGPL